MEMEDLYCLRSRYLASSFQVAALGLGYDKEGANDHSNLIQSKYEGIHFPVIFQQISGKKFSDILGTGWASLFLISDKLKNLLEENHFTGWKKYQILLKDKKGNLIEGYHGFSINGVSGAMTYTNSPTIEIKYTPEGPNVRVYKGAKIDLDKWNKSDLFLPEGTTEIIVVKKVAELLENNKITNLSLDNVAELEVNANIWDKIEKKENKTLHS